MWLLKIAHRDRLLFSLIAFLICGLYFAGYWRPTFLIWDESYYITQALKYKEAIAFTNNHPPLGKLFIHLGDYLSGLNSSLDLSRLTRFDNVLDQSIPYGFSFAGYRFFSVLFSLFSYGFFFLIFRQLIENRKIAFLLSTIFIWETSFFAHNRFAQLDAFLLFGLLGQIYYWLKYFENPSLRYVLYSAFFWAFAVQVKYQALFFAPFLLFYSPKENFDWRHFFKKCLLIFGSTLGLSYLVWFWHLSLLNQFSLWTLVKSPILHMWESLNAELSGKSGGRYLSKPYLWVLGFTPISYRLNIAKDQSSVFSVVMFLNPVNLLLAHAALAHSFKRILSNLSWKKLRIFFYSQSCVAIWLTAVWLINFLLLSTLKRSLYLYHYFPLLLVQWILIAAFWNFYSSKVQRLILALVLLSYLLFMLYYPILVYKELSFSWYLLLRTLAPWRYIVQM